MIAMQPGFGERIRILRMKRSMSQKELAEIMGVTPQAACKWEKDLSYPDITSVYRLSQVLGVTLDELFAPEFGCADEEDA